MTQLRWMLLLLGTLFLVGLALWESLRGRRLRQADPERVAGTGPVSHDRELRDREPLDASLPSFSARDPERARADGPLPVYELPPSEAPEPGRRLDPILDFDGDALAADAVVAAGTAETGAVEGVETDAVMTAECALPEDGFEIGPVRVMAPPPVLAEAEESDALPVLPVLPPVTRPIVEWPDPEHSQVLSVRILASGEKFQGRAVRLALTAQGFVPGRFSIYHKPAQDGRALLSVAGLTKPGTFDDPPRGDMQRFSGLNLFTVLPGPLPPGAAVDELLHVAGILAARLQARLTDDRGEPLSASRAQEMRAMATAQVP